MEKLGLKSIKYDFFILGVTAFVNDLSKRFAPFAEIIGASEFPCYILNTGDEVYMATMTDLVNTKKSTMVTKIPRCVIDLNSISIQQDQLTNPYNRGYFSLVEGQVEKRYNTGLKRIPTILGVGLEIHLENIIQYLKFSQLAIDVLYESSIFTFVYLGKKYQGTYVIGDDLDGESNLSLGFDDERRGRKVPLTIQLEFQYPSFDIINSVALTQTSKRMRDIRFTTTVENHREKIWTNEENIVPKFDV